MRADRSRDQHLDIPQRVPEVPELTDGAGGSWPGRSGRPARRASGGGGPGPRGGAGPARPGRRPVPGTAARTSDAWWPPHLGWSPSCLVGAWRAGRNTPISEDSGRPAYSSGRHGTGPTRRRRKPRPVRTQWRVTAEILPFRIDIPQADLDDLRDRLARTRWPDQLPGAGWDYGIPLEYVRELASYWRDEYDWRVHEARLNGFDQFTTTIDGARVHFLHVRSASPDALPLIVTHGWPGSVVEFWDVIGPLTDPAAYGGSPEDAFHLVVPSIPGYGFSGPTHDRGWDARRVARAWAELMSLLGYQRYGAQGGDWGSIISRELGLADPEHIAGVHLNMFITRVPDDAGELTEEETRRREAAQRFRTT